MLRPQHSSKIGFIMAHNKFGVGHVVKELILLVTSENKYYINPALCPHATKYILHKMGLATCWLAVYADNE